MQPSDNFLLNILRIAFINITIKTSTVWLFGSCIIWNVVMNGINFTSLQLLHPDLSDKGMFVEKIALVKSYQDINILLCCLFQIRLGKCDYLLLTVQYCQVRFSH